ncbi:MAG TPA: hypothetical protein VD963_09260 [Phycisphaerales bacterium]|nr:hypothetical protein [Phycisphaerales bacterium]
MFTCTMALLAVMSGPTAGAAWQPEVGPSTRSVPAEAPETARFWVRPGYEVSVAAADLPGARFMEMSPHGRLLVSRPGMGDILELRDEDGDGTYERWTAFVSDRPTVHGLCWHDGWLWFSTTGSIHKARDTDGDGRAEEIVDVLPVGKLPRGGSHWWRSLLVTNDAIYTSIGDGGNISDQTDSERQKIWRFATDGSGKTLFCSGIRNTEKLRLRPGTRELWGMDHGSDWFGKEAGDTTGNQPITDLNPPEEINHYEEGLFYGHPFVVGNRLPRYEYLKREDIHELAAQTIPPAWSAPAHWSPNGFCFVPEVGADGAAGLGAPGRPGALPADHAGDMIAAFHGSWNSSVPVGYCVARVLFDDERGRPYGLLELVRTLEEQDVLARPVDCVMAPDGSVLFSSDAPGRIYRLRWTGRAPR